MTGIVTEIERYSIHDGPGIRSVVFLKGCQLRCAWCCNPETMEPNVEMGFMPEKCIRCHKCVQDCPHSAIRTDAEGKLRTDRRVCASRCYGSTEEMACTARCFAGARKTIGQRMTVADVVTEVEKDHRLYDRTGGGVTLSGGEVSFQPDFALALLKALKENWIDTAIETNGNSQNGFFERIAPYVDFVFLDIKSMNNEKHIRWTGASNQSSLSAAVTLSKLAKKGQFDLVIRTPIIPGVNDTRQEIREIGMFIQTSLRNAPKWELLAYHALGRSKHTSLGRDYSLEGGKALPFQGLQELESVGHECNIEMVTY